MERPRAQSRRLSRARQLRPPGCDRGPHLQPVLDKREPQPAAQAHDAELRSGKYIGLLDEHTALAEQRYHGLLLGVQRRSANGIGVSANYTLSKCMGHPFPGNNVNPGTGTSIPTTSTTTTGTVSPIAVTCSMPPRQSSLRSSPAGRCASWHPTGGSPASSARQRVAH